MFDSGESPENVLDDELRGEIALGAAVVRQCLDALREHYDVGLILLSQDMPDGKTGRVFTGFGNVFAQNGMATTFLKENHQESNDAQLLYEIV